ncbi:MAG: Zinc finger, type finger, partial [Bacteroidota bacterium]
YEDKISSLIKVQEELEEDLTDIFSKHIINIQKESGKCKRKLKQLSQFYNFSKKIDFGYICPICYNKEISLICVPCGHSFCSGCLKTDYCYLCRTKIEKKQPIFLN